MNSTLEYILNKFKLKMGNDYLVEIPCVGRDDLPNWLHELNFKTGVEVGVAKGKYSEIIVQANPQMKVYGVDIWKAYKDYKHYIDDESFNKLYEEAKNRLDKYSNYEIIRESSMDAAKRFGDNELDFVYLDANHVDPYISQDIVEWSKKIRSGGIISGHDYVRPSKSRRNVFDAEERWDIISAVNRYVKENNIKPLFILGLNAKIPGTIRDNARSWMWIKQ